MRSFFLIVGGIFLIWYWVGKFVFSIVKGLISGFSQSDSRAAQNRVWYDPDVFNMLIQKERLNMHSVYLVMKHSRSFGRMDIA